MNKITERKFQTVVSMSWVRIPPQPFMLGVLRLEIKKINEY